MDYTKIQGVNQPVSRLIFGAAVPVMLGGGDATQILDAAYDAGITAFDTARAYGGSELSLGNWMEKRENRHKITLITKCCGRADAEAPITPERIRRELGESLAALRVPCVDIYFLHKDDKVSAVGPIIETLNELQARGAIGAFGTSNWTWRRMEEAQEYAHKHGLRGLSVSQQCYSFLEQIEDPFHSVCLAGDRNREERQWHIRNRMPVFAYSALARGFLSGKVRSTDGMEKVKGLFHEGFIQEYFHPRNMQRLARLEEMAGAKRLTVPELALAYLVSSLDIAFPIASPSAAHVAANVRATDIQLTREELLWLERGDQER